MATPTGRSGVRLSQLVTPKPGLPVPHTHWPAGPTNDDTGTSGHGRVLCGSRDDTSSLHAVRLTPDCPPEH